MLVEPEDVELGLLTRPGGHDGAALVMDVEHQLGGLRAAVAEQLLEHEHDVAHQIDGVVPDNHDPPAVRDGLVVGLGPLDLGGSGAHPPQATRLIASSASAVMVRLGFTPTLAGTAAPSQTSRFS